MLYCCKTWEFTVEDEARLRGVECRIIRTMCGVRLANRVLPDVFRDRVGVVMKIDDIIQSRLRWHGHVTHGDINCHLGKVMEVETNEKRKKGRQRKSWEECVKKDLERYGLRREDPYDRKKLRERIRAKIANPGQPG